MVKELLKKHEGLRLKPYRCTAGRLTIGYGRNLEERGITVAEAEMMLENDIKWFENELRQELVWFSGKPEVVRAVLIDMAYNLGVGGLLGFKNTLALIEQSRYKEAADAMLKSLWAKQVGKRAIELSELIRNV